GPLRRRLGDRGGGSDRVAPRCGHRQLREHLQPPGRCRGGRGDRRRRAVARAGAGRGLGPGPTALARSGADRRRTVRRRGRNDRRCGVRVGRTSGGEVNGPKGRVIVCPTPIGNLEDVTLRVLSALREADIVACEDTRRARVLLDRYGVSAHTVSYHEHNERARARELVKRMLDGAVVALVSDAGTPLVSDPGFVLVRDCVAAGLAVEVLPGPSAVLSALVASGLPADRWRFAGFLPRKRTELERAFSEPDTLVAFESPRRVASSLGVLAELDPER